MATITSATSGLWSAGSTWVGGVAPVDGDKVIIARPGTGQSSFSTNTAGYLVGATDITLTGATAVGSYTIGELVRFGTDINYYTITNWNNGTKVLTVTPLIVAIPALATVVHLCGHRVTVDISAIVGDDTTTAINVNGILYASRTVNSALTIRGQMYNSVNTQSHAAGQIDYGTLTDPIPSSVTAEIIINHSASLATSKYPLVWQYLNQFNMCGNVNKTPWSRLNGALLVGATSMVVDAASDWAINDWIVIADTGLGVSYEGDLRQITSVTGTTIGFAATTFAHADRAVVGNLTRNVRIRPSSTTFPAQVKIELGSFSNITVVVKPLPRFNLNYCAFENLGVNSTNLSGLMFSTRDFAFETSSMCVMNGITSYTTDLATSVALGGIDLFNTVGTFNAYTINNCVIASRNGNGQSGRSGLKIDNSGANITDTWVLSGSAAISFISNTNSKITRGGWACGGAQAYWQKASNLTVNDCDFGSILRWFIEGTYAPVVINDCRYGFGAGNGRVGQFPWFQLANSGINIAGLSIVDIDLPSTVYTQNQLAGPTSGGTQEWFGALTNSQIDFIRPNGEDRIERKRKNGTIYSENSIINRSNRSLKYVPTINLGADGIYCDFLILGTAGTTYTFKVCLRKNSSYGSANLPSAQVFGQGGTPDTFTMSDSVDTWETGTLTITPITTGEFTLSVKGVYNGVVGSNFFFDGVTIAPFNTFSRHYGYEFNFNPYVTVNPYITQTNEATVGAYTGITINHTTNTITLSINHSIQEVYDYCYYNLCQTANLAEPEFFTTADGVNYTSTYDIVLNGGNLTGSGAITTTGTMTITASETSTVTIAASNGTTGFLNITGLSAHAVYLEDNAATQLDYQASVTGTYSYFIPNTATGTWKFVVKKAGYTYQLGTFTASAGGAQNFATNTPQKLTADGSAMYTGSSSVLCTINITGSTQANIDIGDGSVTLQEAFDETEDALVTNAGTIWLATRGECSIFRSASGNFLFMTNNWRIRRRNAGDVNATLLAYVSSTQGIPKDGTNGDVVIFGVVSAADIATAVLAAMNATPPAVNIKKVNDIIVKGNGTTSNPWNPA